MHSVNGFTLHLVEVNIMSSFHAVNYCHVLGKLDHLRYCRFIAETISPNYLT